MILSRIVSNWHRFRADTRGGVALIFSLSIIPLVLFAGVAVDYARINLAKVRFQSSLDAAALSLTNASETTPLSVLQARADAFFAASYASDPTSSAYSVSVARTGDKLVLTGSMRVPVTLMRVAGYDSVTVASSTKVTASRQQIELALVLDNTGSMGSNGKMTALKAAVNDLIDGLKKKVVKPDDVKMSIVPFNTEVKIDTGFFNASWLRWDVVLENTSLSWFARQPPVPATWGGCLADRDQPYDISSVPAGIFVSRYVAAKCHASSLARLEPLTTDLEKIRTRANSMTPNGNTNVTIGYAMGLATLRSDSPFGLAASTSSNVLKFMIVLTDGDNTSNRWAADAASIDPRLESACAAAKASAIDSKVRVYTIRVINGNGPLLQKCASDPAMYFDVKNASELQPVFRKILESIQGVRIVS
ncbi:MAG: VWA domain-containing protein [Beijerinckiaceae bacterium]